jgi:hypothetical protein
VAVEEAGERPYEQAVEHLKRHHGIRLSKRFLEKLTQMVGEFWLEADDRDAGAKVRHNTIPFEVSGEGPQCCCVFADGTMIHTDGEWHEVRVGTVCTTGGGDKRKRSIARFADLDRFGADLWRKACECGYQKASLRAFISDGSHWIRSIAEFHFADAVPILDWYHLAEHLSKCANELFGEGTEESQRWAERMRCIMKEGRVEQALEEVERLSGRSNSKRRAKHELITYLRNNRDRVDYPRYRMLGLPIGSGEVEADCKTVVQARCKQSGMRWSTGGAEQVLRVRCALKDESFHHLWDHPGQSITAWHKRQLRQERKAAA